MSCRPGSEVQNDNEEKTVHGHPLWAGVHMCTEAQDEDVCTCQQWVPMCTEAQDEDVTEQEKSGGGCTPAGGPVRQRRLCAPAP